MLSERRTCFLGGGRTAADLRTCEPRGEPLLRQSEVRREGGTRYDLEGDDSQSEEGLEVQLRPAPPNLNVGSLCSCVGTDVVEYEWPLDLTREGLRKEDFLRSGRGIGEGFSGMGRERASWHESMSSSSSSSSLATGSGEGEGRVM